MWRWRRFAQRRLGLLHVAIRLCELLIISGSDLMNSSLAVKSLSDGFVSLNKLVQFLSQLIILVGDHLDMVVQGINFNLQVGVVVEQG